MTPTPQELAELILHSDSSSIVLRRWLFQHQIERGMGQLRADEEAHRLVPGVARAIDRRLNAQAHLGVTSAYRWVDPMDHTALVRAGLETGDAAARRTVEILQLREEIRSCLDRLTGRQFEHLCGFLLSSYGLSDGQWMITQQSNEGGVDFVAVHEPAPVEGRTRLGLLRYRILGQAKRYSAPVEVDKVDAFCSRLEDCRAHRGRAWEFSIPQWFKDFDAPILGLFVTSSTVGPSGRAALRDHSAFLLAGDQVAQDLAEAARGGRWSVEGRFDCDRFVSEFPLS